VFNLTLRFIKAEFGLIAICGISQLRVSCNNETNTHQGKDRRTHNSSGLRKVLNIFHVTTLHRNITSPCSSLPTEICYYPRCLNPSPGTQALAKHPQHGLKLPKTGPQPNSLRRLYWTFSLSKRK
jgi:hypothetical protein